MQQSSYISPKFWGHHCAQPKSKLYVLTFDMEPMLVSNSESSRFYLPSAEITGTSHYIEDSVLRRQRQTEFCELEARLVYMWSFRSGRAIE